MMMMIWFIHNLHHTLLHVIITRCQVRKSEDQESSLQRLQSCLKNWKASQKSQNNTKKQHVKVMNFKLTRRYKKKIQKQICERETTQTSLQWINTSEHVISHRYLTFKQVSTIVKSVMASLSKSQIMIMWQHTHLQLFMPFCSKSSDWRLLLFAIWKHLNMVHVTTYATAASCAENWLPTHLNHAFNCLENVWMLLLCVTCSYQWLCITVIISVESN